MKRIGLDIGSTTMKCVVVDENNQIIYKNYERHFSEITEKAKQLLTKLQSMFPDEQMKLCISGSAGMGLSENIGIDFLQEVYATRVAVQILHPDTDVVIELGGEDAKILFLSGAMEVRMNGSCAGGTGAFIDQMATLLKVTPTMLNEIAQNADKIYPIASRCGVFAKTDIQPLLNQGAKKENVAKSIFRAVVNQTVAGLSQGRKIEGTVLYLGGPLTFFSELRKSFDEILKIKGVFPEDSLYFVAYGAAIRAEKNISLAETIDNLSHYRSRGNAITLEPLFRNEEEYLEFTERHQKDDVKRAQMKEGEKVYLGIDAGSTTIKMALINEKHELILSHYQSNSGNPVPIVKDFLMKLYEDYPSICIAGAASTGYGEELIRNAFNLDTSLVETMAHLTAAKEFMPDVEFVLDIGGQDIKCFKIRNGMIDNIFLNEACSSGCGSFLQSFANALGYDVEEFTKLAIFADHPIDLGSRCTVFMNSSVKQAQKDGATIENISAGLSMSVVKNALYKVIRVQSVDELGKNIVVQGGTFCNDAVLRTFEKELNINVCRPVIAGLMGAYGAAIYTQMLGMQKSSILDRNALEEFTVKEKNVRCGLCSNNCMLTVNTFGKNSFISGNKCERPLKKKNTSEINAYEEKRKLLTQYFSCEGTRERIGIPLGLNMYELLPFWFTLFKELGFSVLCSGFSEKDTYLKGQTSIPSDTVCYPAKLMHGHIQTLLDKKVDAVFYPCMTYNVDEHRSDNCFNCPVVAYYPEVIHANMDFGNVPFIGEYVKINNERIFAKKITQILQKYFDDINYKDVKKASKKAFLAYKKHIDDIQDMGLRLLKKAEDENRLVLVLAGRPYHIDRQINHSIDNLITSLGVALLSEDSLPLSHKKIKTDILNQWTYHSRLYLAADYVNRKENAQLIQLVSFGCGLDAITSDEVSSILARGHKIYTQIKIDEITNLGAVKIRIRSLLSAIAQRKMERKEADEVKHAE